MNYLSDRCIIASVETPTTIASFPSFLSSFFLPLFLLRIEKKKRFLLNNNNDDDDDDERKEQRIFEPYIRSSTVVSSISFGGLSANR